MRRHLWFIAGTATAAVIGSSLVALQPEGGPVARQTPALQIGMQIAPDDIHWVSTPGRYGLGTVPAGSRYAVVSGNLVRINPDNGRLQAILRPVKRLLD